MTEQIRPNPSSAAAPAEHDPAPAEAATEPRPDAAEPRASAPAEPAPARADAAPADQPSADGAADSPPAAPSADVERAVAAVPPPPEAPASGAVAAGAPVAAGRSGKRRALRAVARWTAAVLVCGGLGAGTAYGITSMERTDVPGLATESDGRWDYPRLALPALPEGSPRPFTSGNRHEIHHADLRDLLLPAPVGATVDKELNGGWVSTDRYVSEYVEDRRAGLRQALDDSAVRHIAARGWTMPDGTTSRVYLLRFNSADMADDYMDRKIGGGLSPDTALASAPDEVGVDEKWESGSAADGRSAVSVYTESKPIGPEHTRQAYVVAGDTVALIVHTRKGEALSVPFHQTVVLQNQLLG
ncbi:hypothetical protein [Streptomyces wuyuanensis]|uniref:Uncharacterized protein n=1 Tax=Streptomyces wuyuanensis TaxID=1196353 RepID=A0A1H0BXE1_9ACTN|nr:hypothetical protein [Streptomyces wuyuanensis]SDN50282.1 hypothetical protein SAMN05444921_12886 [Streptomyces wuyuanensis]